MGEYKNGMIAQFSCCKLKTLLIRLGLNFNFQQAVHVGTRYAPPRPSPPPVGAPAPRVPPSRRNVAVISQTKYVLTVTAAPASRVKAAVNKAAWLP